jgi:DNA replication and repair protein RecF
MLVEGVELRDFRSYSRAHAHIAPGLTIVHGPNGAGKSNLLEGIYYGCTGRSPRTRNERELVRFGARAARAVVQLRDGADAHELSVGYEAPADGRPATKRMRCDGAPVERMLDLDARPLISVFEPDRLELVKGAPGARRAHLDQLVAALWPSRAQHRRDYSRVLVQRNALLARIRSRSASSATLSSWDHELARTALAVTADRAAAVGLIALPFSERAAQLGCRGPLELSYRPRSAARTEDEFLAELQARLERDLQRGFSGHGPHRDELSITREGRELRTYGSQGEQRLALLALLLAERSVLERERGRLPLMLLDDVMSELDSERREALVADLSAGGQSVIATTDLANVPHALGPNVGRLRVGGGTILGEAAAA